MTRVELNMKRRLHEGFPGTRDRHPTGEKEYKHGVNSTQLNPSKRALEKCGLEKVDRGDLLNASSGEYQLVIDWADGCDPIEIDSFVSGKSGKETFGELGSVVHNILAGIGAEEDFLDMFNSTYGDTGIFSNVTKAIDSWLEEGLGKSSEAIMNVSQETVNTVKSILDSLKGENIIGSDPVNVTIDEVNMNPARAKKVAKVPQRSLHFENRQYRGKAKEALKEAVEADINKQAKQIQKDLTALIDDNWADEDTEEDEDAEIANRIVINSVLNGAYTALKDYCDVDAYMVGDEIPGLEDCDEAIVDEVNEMISDLYGDNMESDDDLDELSETLCKKMVTIVYKVVMQYEPADEIFVDHGKALFN